MTTESLFEGLEQPSDAAEVGFSSMTVPWEETAQAFGRFDSPFWMSFQIEIDLHRMDAADSVTVRGPLEHPLVCRKDEPDVRPCRVFAEAQSFEERLGRVFGQVEIATSSDGGFMS